MDIKSEENLLPFMKLNKLRKIAIVYYKMLHKLLNVEVEVMIVKFSEMFI